MQLMQLVNSKTPRNAKNETQMSKVKAFHSISPRERNLTTKETEPLCGKFIKHDENTLGKVTDSVK